MTIKSRTSLAFTLAELLTVITISSLLIAIGVPAYYELARNNAVRSDAETLAAAFYTAKNNALDSGTAATVCPIYADEDSSFGVTEGISCISDNSEPWSSWMVFKGNYTGTEVEPANIIAVYVVDRTPFTLNGSSNNFVSFLPTGFSSGSVRFLGEPEPCPQGKKLSREIEIHLSGKIDMKRVSCSASRITIKPITITPPGGNKVPIGSRN